MGESTSERVSVSEVFREANRIYRRDFGKVLLVALILLVPVALGFVSGPVTWLIATVLSLATTAWVAGSMARLVEAESSDSTASPSAGQLLKRAWPKLLMLFFLTILMSVLMTIGLFFLIVPGVMLALVLLVAIPAMVIEDLGVFASFSRSEELTKGVRMQLLPIGLFFLVMQLDLIGFLGLPFDLLLLSTGIPTIVDLLLLPYVGILTAVLYLTLRDDDRLLDR